MNVRRVAFLFGIALMPWAVPPANAQATCTRLHRQTCSFSQTSQKTLGNGIVLKTGTVACRGNISNVYVLKIDMTTPGRVLTATPAPMPQPTTPPPDKYTGSMFDLQLPTSFLSSLDGKKNPVKPVNAVGLAAVNANLFTNSPHYTLPTPPSTWLRGMEAAGGNVNNPVKANTSDVPPSIEYGEEGGHRCKETLALDFDATLIADSSGRAEIRRIGAAADAGQAVTRIMTAVTGSHMLVLDGRVVAPACPPPSDRCRSEFFGPNSRTSVGLSKDRNTMLMVVVDSTPPGTGVQLDELASLMQQLEADAAINLDGGGSSVMAIRTEGAVSVVNRPRQSHTKGAQCTYVVHGACERYVGNSLAVGILEKN